MIARNLALSMVLQVPTYNGAHAQITRWRMALMIDDATVDFLRAEVNRKFASEADAQTGHA